MNDKEIIDGFVTESKEHLYSMEDDILLLEKQKDAPDDDLVNKIFRAMHTIKGGAGFLGFEKISQLSHLMETLLSMIRSGKMAPDSLIADALLEGTDRLNMMLDNIDNTNDVDIAVSLERLEKLLDQRVSQEVRRDLDASVPLAGPDGNTIDFTVSLFDAAELEAQNNSLYLVKYDLNHVYRKQNRSPMDIINQLLVTGRILDGHLSTPVTDMSQSVLDTPLFYEVLYMSEVPAQTLLSVLNLDPDRIVPLRMIENTGETTDTVTESKPEPVPEPNSQPEPTAELQTETQTETGIAPADEAGTETGLETGPSTSGDAENTPTVAVEKTNTIRLNVSLLDRLMNLAGELVLVRNQQRLHMDRTAAMSAAFAQRLDVVTTELQETVMRTRMQPIGNLLARYPRMVRDLAKKLSKRIDIQLEGKDVELDKTILESLADPLTHMVRNCCDHGIETPARRKEMGKPETGTILIKAFHEAGQINILVKDDGKGIDTGALKAKVLEKGLRTKDQLAHMNQKELTTLIMLPGLSTADNVSKVSGRGVGMDVVKANINQLHGSLDIDSQPGRGTAMRLNLPLTLAIIPSLIVMSGEDRYAIPQINLDELVALYDDEVYTRIECAGDKEIYRLRDRLLPLARLSEILAHPKPFTTEDRAAITESYRKRREEKRAAVERGDESETGVLHFVVLKVGAQRFGLIIDRVVGSEEIVLKPMHPALRSLPCYAGATVMGDGHVALVLDAAGISRHSGILEEHVEDDDDAQKAQYRDSDSQELMIFKAGERERFALELTAIKRIEEIQPHQIETVGKKEFITINDTSTRVLRMDHLLEVSPTLQREYMFLIIPKEPQYPCGFLASSLVDIETVNLQWDKRGYRADGVNGTAVINDKMTLLADMSRLMEKAQSSGNEPGQQGALP